MNKILKVARREFFETIKTKAFIIGILLAPVIMGIAFLFIRFQEKTLTGPRPAKKLALLNLSEEVSAELDSAFANHNRSNPQRQIVLKKYSEENLPGVDTRTQELKEAVREGEFDAFLFLGKGVLDSVGRGQFYTKKAADITFFPSVRYLVNDAVFKTRFRQRDISPELIAELRRRVPMDEVDLSGKVEKKRNKVAMMFVPAAFMFLMVFGIFAVSQGLLMSVIEEKTSRVVEVILSAVSPFQLMAGKILGIYAVGLCLISLYGTVMYATISYYGVGDVVSAGMIVYFIIYYMLGFLLISSMLAAIGSACNDIKESQTLLQPVMLLLMVPMFAWFIIVQRPEGTLATVLSFIPPMTPLVMILRLAAHPDLPLFQIIASILLLAVSVPAVIWAAAKIFRTGILMYGKPPSLRELIRWVRYD